MGFWPFGGGKKGRTLQGEDQGQHTLLEKSPTLTPSGHKGTQQEDFEKMGRTWSRRGQDEKPLRLSKQRNQGQQGNVSRVHTMPIPIPGVDPWRKGSAMTAQSHHGSDMYQHNPLSHSSIGAEDFTALSYTPTLRAKRKGYDPAVQRRKSSKRKAEDYAREREVRAMSYQSPGLRRPATFSGSGPLQRDTMQVPGDLNRRLQRPASQISLPQPDVVLDPDNFENQASFKIGIFAALSPRPTLTYVTTPRTTTGKQPSRLKPSIERAIEEEDTSSKRRIDELADDLDAGGLRELMERDRRRHERKKLADRDRLQRKLQRRADGQREEEARGRQGRDAITSTVGLGVATDGSRGRPSRAGEPGPSGAARLERNPSPRGMPTDPFVDPNRKQPRPSQQIRNIFEDEKDIDIMDDPFAHEDDEDEGPPIPVKSPLRTVSPTHGRAGPPPSQAAISPPTSPIQRATDGQSFSQTSGLGRELTPDIPEHAEPDRRASDQSGQLVSSWTSFFKRGTRRKTSNVDRGRSTPSEFSNTSRESFARKQQPPPVVIPRTFRRSDASPIPQRTMSKFREDLPEFPISPPDSRVQSPEASTIPQSAASQSAQQPRRSRSGTADNQSLTTSASIPGFERGSPDQQPQQVQGIDVDMSGGGPSATGLSQSLASLDSEGSWLSGKPMKRFSSGAAHPLRQSQSSLQEHIPGAFEPEAEELANDEYLSGLTPGPRGRQDSLNSAERKASSTIIDLEKERERRSEPDVPALPHHETWHEGLGRQATVIRQPNRAKSKEGLLKEKGKENSSDSDVEDDGDNDEDDKLVEEGGAQLLRARSVEYKGHARHMSAGSARLLDIRRSSTHSDIPAPPRTPTLVPPSNLDQQERSR